METQSIHHCRCGNFTLLEQLLIGQHNIYALQTASENYKRLKPMNRAYFAYFDGLVM